jgi:hypothetical protein
MDYEDDRTLAERARNLLEPQTPLIFLSYAKEDGSKVKVIYKKLRREHLNPWLDIADLLPGQEWDKVIIKTIRHARFVIVFLSKNSVNKRGYVQKEIKEALDAAEMMPEGEIFIIPVRLEECEVPERLSTLQWIDIFKTGAFKKIVVALKDNFYTGNTSSVSKSRVNAKLVVMDGEDHEAVFQLRKIISFIGRADRRSNAFPDIDLSHFGNSRRVSRSHALVFRIGNSFIVKDCGSSNGTIINDSTILRANQTRILKSGDKLQLGDKILYFVSNWDGSKKSRRLTN